MRMFRMFLAKFAIFRNKNITFPLWDVEIARSNRVTRTKAPRSDAPGGLFIVYCGADFEGVYKFDVLL